MFKPLLSLLTTLLLALPTWAGQLPVTLSGAPNLTVRGGYTQAAPLQATITITNNSTQSLNLRLQRTVLQEVSGSENNFCFGIGCYPPNVSLSPPTAPVTLAAGASDNSMVLDYTPNGQAGTTIVRYAVFSTSSPDTAYLTVRYEALTPTAVAPEKALVSAFQAYPNPVAAGQAATIHVDRATVPTASAVVLVELATGRRVRTQTLTTVSGNEALPTAGLAHGLYACLLLDSRQQLLASRRLLVE